MQKILLILLLFIISTISIAQDKEDDKEDDKKDDKKKKEKTYSEIIDDSYKTDEGLFTVHSKNDKFLYEISPDLLGKEMLMVTRIAKTANGIGYGGQKINSQVLRWQKKHDKILLRIVSYENVASDTLPISKSVKNSNFEPVLYSFDIKTYNPSDSSVVIDVRSFIQDRCKGPWFSSV